MSSVSWLAVSVLGGLITFALRLSFIALIDAIELPDAARAALRFVPVAVFSAILAPLLLVDHGQINIAFDNLSAWAALVPAVVAWKTRSVLYTVVVGMLTLWLLIYLSGAG